LVALCVLSMLEEGQPDVMNDFPDMYSYYIRMRNLPEIKDYVEKAWPPAALVSSSKSDVEAA
uniref:DDE_Tnp_1_7 domain-containing protein n=1 Tax=Heligmosomoides polygyrus TaxID=6339 RepID=A0A183GTT3_HELPZ